MFAIYPQGVGSTKKTRFVQTAFGRSPPRRATGANGNREPSRKHHSHPTGGMLITHGSTGQEMIGARPARFRHGHFAIPRARFPWCPPRDGLRILSEQSCSILKQNWFCNVFSKKLDFVILVDIFSRKPCFCWIPM